MSYHPRIFSSRLPAVLLALCLGAGVTGFAAEPATDAAPNLTVSQINRLVARGALSKKDAAELLLMAEADAAEARAKEAMMQAQLAQAEAALARARALAAQAGHLRNGEEPATRSVAAPVATVAVVATEPAPRPGPPAPLHALPMLAAAPVENNAESTPASEPPDPVATMANEASEPVATASEAPPEPAPTRAQTIASEPTEIPPPAPVVAQKAPSRRAATPAPADATEEKIPEDTVRVTYVPEIVKEQLREELKADVMAQAREENWAAPNTIPDWVTRFRLFGDVRVRGEGIIFPAGNDNTGAFPNFNAINTGAPFDVSGTVFSPQYDVDQDRNRLRLRARLGAAVDLGEGYSAGLRLATGENNSPVTQNQSLGAAGAGQGGNFSKYALWLDRGFLKYEVGGLPDQDLAFTFGRFDNPFFATNMIWADDIGFDGFATQGKFPVSEDITPFFVVGAFPVFNTDLNFATNQPAKFKSNDKWLYAAQLGVTLEFSKDFSLKLGGSYYYFQNIEGKRSTPYTPLTAVDAGDTDSSRPAFAQRGNTYMALRDIIPGPLNNNGTTNQYQYFGLASKFQELALDGRLDYNAFEPFQVSLVGEWVKNRSFNRAAIAAKAVNNLGVATGATGAFLGSDTAWMVGATFGKPSLGERWDWNVSLGYRKVGSDALVDGFNDSDFGGGGTNLKGYTFGANLALSARTWIGLRWLSATAIAGPAFKADLIQLDFNGKF